MFTVAALIKVATVRKSVCRNPKKQCDGQTFIVTIKNVDFARNLLPNYIFEHKELSGLFDKMNLLDPCIERNTELDEDLIKLKNADNPEKIFSERITK